jgi:hypothetical protein
VVTSVNRQKGLEKEDGEITLSFESFISDDPRTPLKITNLSLPACIQYGVNSGGRPILLGASGFLLSQE